MIASDDVSICRRSVSELWKRFVAELSVYLAPSNSAKADDATPLSSVKEVVEIVATVADFFWCGFVVGRGAVGNSRDEHILQLEPVVAAGCLGLSCKTGQ